MAQGKLYNQHMMAALDREIRAEPSRVLGLKERQPNLRPKTMSGAVKIASQIATVQWAAEQLRQPSFIAKQEMVARLQTQDESSVFNDFEIKQ